MKNLKKKVNLIAFLTLIMFSSIFIQDQVIAYDSLPKIAATDTITDPPDYMTDIDGNPVSTPNPGYDIKQVSYSGQNITFECYGDIVQEYATVYWIVFHNNDSSGLELIIHYSYWLHSDLLYYERAVILHTTTGRFWDGSSFSALIPEDAENILTSRSEDTFIVEVPLAAYEIKDNPWHAEVEVSLQEIFDYAFSSEEPPDVCDNPYNILNGTCDDEKGTAIMLVVDISGSIDKAYSRHCADIIINDISPYTWVGLVTFAGSATLKESLEQPTNALDKASLLSAIYDSTYGGSTNIFGGLMTAIEEISQMCFESKKIIILTDGLTNTLDNCDETGLFKYCNEFSYNNWITLNSSPLAIAADQGICISALSIGPEYNEYFFDAVEEFACNEVFNADNIIDFVNKIKDISNRIEGWDDIYNTTVMSPMNSCVNIYSPLSWDVSSFPEGTVLKITLLWLTDHKGVLIIRNEDTLQEIPQIYPSSQNKAIFYVAYIKLDESITNITVWACLNISTLLLSEASNLKTSQKLTLYVPSYFGFYDVAMKSEDDFEDWLEDPGDSESRETANQNRILGYNLFYLFGIIGILTVISAVLIKKRILRSTKKI